MLRSDSREFGDQAIGVREIARVALCNLLYGHRRCLHRGREMIPRVTPISAPKNLPNNFLHFPFLIRAILMLKLSVMPAAISWTIFSATLVVTQNAEADPVNGGASNSPAIELEVKASMRTSQLQAIQLSQSSPSQSFDSGKNARPTLRRVLVTPKGSSGRNLEPQPQLFSGAKAREIRVGQERGVAQLILIDSMGREQILPVTRGLEDGVLLAQWDEDDALLIESELQEKAGAYYRLPATRDELLAELGLPRTSSLSEGELMDLLAVQIERQLGTTPATSAFLLEQMELRRQREAVAEGSSGSESVEFDFDELERDLLNMQVADSQAADPPLGQSAETSSGPESHINSARVREALLASVGRGLTYDFIFPQVAAEAMRSQAESLNLNLSWSFTFESVLNSRVSPTVVEAHRDSISTSL